jgi:hypothetical protein
LSDALLDAQHVVLPQRASRQGQLTARWLLLAQIQAVRIHLVLLLQYVLAVLTR